MNAQGKGAAWGKAILLGEHAVVYGRPAIAVALEQKVTALAVSGPGKRVHLSAPDWGVEAVTQGESLADAALTALVRHLGMEGVGIEVILEAELPLGAGLGASAAQAVATARALGALRGQELTDVEAAAAALVSEQVLHGSPSGIDNAIAAHGGIRYFRREAALSPVRIARGFELIVGHTGVRGSTRETVATVAALWRGRSAEVEERLDEIAALVEASRDALVAGDLETVGECMIENHARLQWLGVSTYELDRLVDLALEAGALGAKLTGGGGGGCAIAMVPAGVEGAVEAVTEAWSRAAHALLSTEVAPTGLPVLG